MWFYLQEVLQLQPVEEGKIVMPQNDLGTLIHGSIEAAYKQMNGGESKNDDESKNGVKFKPIEVSPEKIQAFLHNGQAVTDALVQGFASANKAYRRRHEGAGDFYKMEEHKAETLVARTHMKNVLESDMLTARSGLEIVAMEKFLKFPLKLTIEGESISITIGGMLDRLDKTGGQMRVIDYKTGKYDKDKLTSLTLEALFKEGSEKTFILQTLIYCKAVLHNGLNDKHRISSGLWFTGKKDCNPQLKLLGKPFTDYTEIQQKFEPLLTAKVEEIMTATTFSKCAEDKCKPYCPFLLLCGRHPKEY